MIRWLLVVWVEHCGEMVAVGAGGDAVTQPDNAAIEMTVQNQEILKTVDLC